MNDKKNITVLATLKFGSSLYGTNDETSDIDLKSIYLADIKQTLLGKAPKNFKLREAKPNEKVAAGDTEVEYIPLQRLAFDFLDGQTYAYEMVFAFLQEGNLVEYVNKDYRAQLTSFLKGLSSKFLTSDISKIVAYAMHQANMYGLKGGRLNAFNSLVSTLTPYVSKKEHIRLIDVKEVLDKLIDTDHIYYGHVFSTVTGKKDLDALFINKKAFHLTNTVAYVVEEVEKMIAKYGHRAAKARDNEVDWKALSHAIRISYQSTELLQTGRLQFPLQIADYLRNVKRGRVDYDDAVRAFELFNDEMLELLKTTSLKTKTPDLRDELEGWLARWLLTFYRLQGEL